MTSNFQAKEEALQREQTSINFQFLGVICALLDPLITTGSSPDADPKQRPTRTQDPILFKEKLTCFLTPVEQRRGSSGSGGKKLDSLTDRQRKLLQAYCWLLIRGEPRSPGNPVCSILRFIFNNIANPDLLGFFIPDPWKEGTGTVPSEFVPQFRNCVKVLKVKKVLNSHSAVTLKLQ
jgi:hypothetical protein